MSKWDDLRSKAQDELYEAKGDAHEARSQLKDLWAENVVFRAAVIVAGVVALIVLVAVASA